MARVLSAVGLDCERDDRHLFRDLSFDVASGEILHLTGPNGSGKTTLLRRLVGISSVVEGAVTWFPDAPESTPEPCEKIWYIAHRPAVTLLQSPLENMAYALALHGIRLPESVVWEALETVGLRGFEDVPSHQLSAGQQRRVALARLYLPLEPERVRAWVLDEPLTALDVEAVDRLKARILAYAQAGGSVIMTSHHGLDSETVRTLELGAS
ncbi:MAG TPA: cytochrome c biogenesis heme-transporting ATPase CcmA [Saccharospirillum sp.]|nr:cytochrome c biogenesis heme-transporting ATPase CcmA [Saccharospirillum sp.]